MEKAGVALYHRVLRRENFEKAAKDLVSLVYAAEKKEPGKPRILYLDIDGHRNAQNGFDVDMLELQKEFGLNFLLPFLTEIHFPMISMRNNNAQRNDVPEQLEIFRARNEKNHSLDDLYVENFSHTEYQLEESVYAYLKWVSDFLKRYHELDVTLLPPEPYDPQNYLLQWRLHMRELINELFNMFVGGNLFSAAAMTRTLMECCVYGKVLKQEKSARLLEDWFLCGMIRGLRGENGALWQAGVKIVYELCSDWNRDPEETIRRFKKGNENEWLASVLPSKGRISFYQVCEYLQEKELYQTYQWACAFVHGQDIRSKMHPFTFYDSTYHLLTVMMYCIFRAIRLFPVSEKLEAEMQDLERGLAALWSTTSWDHGHELSTHPL